MNNILKSSSKKVVFPLMMASALWTGIPQTVCADTLEVQAVMQAVTVKGTVVDANGEPYPTTTTSSSTSESSFSTIFTGAPPFT